MLKKWETFSKSIAIFHSQEITINYVSIFISYNQPMLSNISEFVFNLLMPQAVKWNNVHIYIIWWTFILYAILNNEQY